VPRLSQWYGQVECQAGDFRENTGYPEDYAYMRNQNRNNITDRLWPDAKQYADLCCAFSYKTLSYQADALKAFCAITTVLAASFPGGFLYAMPEFVFGIALAWRHHGREAPVRRHMFPSWSWLGWEGTILMPTWNPIDNVDVVNFGVRFPIAQ
jgi:hypothetical protein